MTENRLREIVCGIFESRGYARLSVGQPDELEMTRDGQGFRLKVIASRGAVYASRRIVPAARALAEAATESGQMPVLVVCGILSPAVEAEVRQTGGGLGLTDIRDLLEMARPHRDLYDELVAALPYAVGTPAPYEPPRFDPLFPACIPDPCGPVGPIGIDFGNSYISPELLPGSTAQQGNADLCDELRNWRGGKDASLSADYEKLCARVLRRLFGADLILWKEQRKSNAGLFRFDMICKIRCDHGKDFWQMAERYFSSRYLIFEFKNYARRVTQKEVYTTARYLYTKALRGVAVIISPRGVDENGSKAIRGIIRDEGKLILALSHTDLIRMLEMMDYGEDPADHLSDMLDELLIDLEK